MKKAAPQSQQSSPSHGHDNPSPAELVQTAPTKIARVLAYLLVPCNSLNRFEAEALGDHCLPSTISALEHRHGLQFQHQPEQVPNRWGKPCGVTRYRLPESQRERARQVLALLAKPAGKRGEVAA